MSVQSSLQATTSLVSQTKHLSNQFRKSCSVKASTTTSSSIDTNTFALHGKSGRKCMLTGKRANNGYTVSFSHIRNKKLQQANLQVRVRSRLMSPIGLRVCFPQRCHNSSFFLSTLVRVFSAGIYLKSSPLETSLFIFLSTLLTVQTRILAGTKAIHSLAHFHQSD